MVWDGVRRTYVRPYFRPRDPGKSFCPIVVKIGTWVHFGVDLHFGYRIFLK